MLQHHSRCALHTLLHLLVLLDSNKTKTTHVCPNRGLSQLCKQAPYDRQRTQRALCVCVCSVCWHCVSRGVACRGGWVRDQPKSSADLALVFLRLARLGYAAYSQEASMLMTPSGCCSEFSFMRVDHDL